MHRATFISVRYFNIPYISLIYEDLSKMIYLKLVLKCPQLVIITPKLLISFKNAVFWDVTPHDVTSQNRTFFVVTAVKTSNVTF
jgi:hypothetical protein